MKRLIAVSPILFNNHNYKPGDELPIYNLDLVAEWVHNGAAVWWDEEQKKQTIKAKSASAPAGLPGDAYPSSGSEQDLTGKVPSGKIRGAKPEPSKKRRKSSE